MFRFSLMLIVTAVLASTAAAQELSERLSSPLRGTLKSGKAPYDLEFCVADAITKRGGAKPTVIRTGRENVVVFGYENSATIAVSLIATEEGSALEVRTRGNDMDDRLIADLRLCL